EALDGATGTGIHRHGEQQVGNRLWQGIALHRVPIHGPVEVKDLVVGERLQVVHGRVWFTSTATPTGEGRERDPHVGVPARVRGVVHIAALSLQDEAQGTDRKSTRLNSSHVKISYAVFCLKKKKK